MKLFKKSLTILSLLTACCSLGALDYPPSSPTNDFVPGATNIIFQSIDGGQTWQDISEGLPENDQPEGFFAGESDLYLRVQNVTYRSKSNLKTPVWEKENVPELENASIIFNRSGVMAYNYRGQIYQRMSPAGTWVPTYTNFGKNKLLTIFEASDGTVFIGRDKDGGLFKSADQGQSWKQVQQGWVMDIIESKGVLVATGQGGIMRSTDNGDHWESVFSEGGVGIAVERIDGGFAAIKAGRIHLSFDDGKTWKAIDEGLPPSLSGTSIKQMGKYLICGHPDGIFRSSDMGKTWNSVHPSVDKDEWNTVSPNDRKVFRIYVSGNVLYAVAGNAGC